MPEAIELQNLGLNPKRFAGAKIVRADGCAECGGTGYSGRMVVSELMIIDDGIRSLIMGASDASTIKKCAQESGMVSIRDSGIQAVLQGVTTAAELVSVTQE